MSLADWNLMGNKIVPAALVTILLCAALLRICGLGLKSLEADEIFTVAVADPHSSLVDVVSRSLAQYHASKPPPYFLLTHFFLRLEDHDSLLRFPSLAFGVLGVAATYAMGAALFGTKEGLVAALLLCISPLHIRYSQWSRFYTMLLTFSVLSLYFLRRGMSKGDERSWLGFIFANVLNLYTHAFAFLVLFSEGLSFMLAWLRGIVFTRRTRATSDTRDNEWTQRLWGSLHPLSIFIFILTLMIVAIAYVPMVSHLLINLAGPGGISEGANTPGLELSLSFFKGLLMEWSTGSGIVLLIFLALFFMGILASLRNQRMEVLLAVLWIGVPFAVLFAVPMQHRFYGRYLVFLLPIYLIVIARGLTAFDDAITWALERVGGERWRRSWVGSALGLAVLGALSVSPLHQLYAERASDWKTAAALLGDMMSPGEAIMVRRPQFEIALLRYDERLEDVEFGVVSPRDVVPSDLEYQEGIWFVGKEGRKNEMSRLEYELLALTGGPVFKLVFEGYGDHTAPGAGESMFWDVWVLYVREGLDKAQVIELYEHALDTAPAYATGFIYQALQDLSMDEQTSAGAIQERALAIALDPKATEAHRRLALADAIRGMHDQVLVE